MLIYLNRDWQEDYGAHLELWDAGLTACRKRILPVFNRTVVFSTTDGSYHGHPHPLTSPAGVTRKSISLAAARHALLRGLGRRAIISFACVDFVYTLS